MWKCEFSELRVLLSIGLVRYCEALAMAQVLDFFFVFGVNLRGQMNRKMRRIKAITVMRSRRKKQNYETKLDNAESARRWKVEGAAGESEISDEKNYIFYDENVSFVLWQAKFNTATMAVSVGWGSGGLMGDTKWTCNKNSLKMVRPHRTGSTTSIFCISPSVTLSNTQLNDIVNITWKSRRQD